jgi:hypothetical protein
MIKLDKRADAVEHLGCFENSIYQLVASDDLHAFDIAPLGSWRSTARIRSVELETFIEITPEADPLGTAGATRAAKHHVAPAGFARHQKASTNWSQLRDCTRSP